MVVDDIPGPSGVHGAIGVLGANSGDELLLLLLLTLVDAIMFTSSLPTPTVAPGPVSLLLAVAPGPVLLLLAPKFGTAGA